MEVTMKSMAQLTCCLLKEVGAQTGISTARDEETILARTAKEGESFLTISLPAFSKDLLIALDTGAVRQTLFTGFARRTKSELPKFLGGFFELLFSNEGELLHDTSRDVSSIVRSMRQVLLLHSKVELPCTPQRVKAALEGYVATDKEIKEIPSEDISRFRDMSMKVLGKYFSTVERNLYEIVPRHSSGALATRESYNSRFGSRLWTERLQEVFPFWDYLLSTSSEVDEESDPVTILDLAAETPSKVTTVPKTLKSLDRAVDWSHSKK
jgi:hypothetical protein